MTHDELLAKMKELSRTFAYEPNLNFESALRAVVELHKPVVKPHMPLFCAECDGYADYPCATIKAIAKELQ